MSRLRTDSAPGGQRRQHARGRPFPTVVSTSIAGKAIIDAGSKTMSGDRLLTEDGKGYGAGRLLRVGERLRIIPNHACTCVNMHDRVHGVQGEGVVAEWRVAGRGKVR